MKAIIEDVWGNEARICDTARLSASDRKIEGNALVDRDKRLIGELLYGQHGVPFETMMFRIRMEIPIFVARQLVKHRISAWSEMSKRYRGGVGSFYAPRILDAVVDGFEVATHVELSSYRNALECLGQFRADWLNAMYARIEEARSKGELPPDAKNGRDPWRARARELARMLEPVAEYTEVVWTINLRSLANVFDLRLDQHAQYETRQIAAMIWNQFEDEHPLLARYIERYRDKMWRAREELIDELNEEFAE